MSDPYLILTGLDGSVLTFDDDRDAGFNALISGFTLPGNELSSYTIEATSWGGETGTYSLGLSSAGTFTVLPPKTSLLWTSPKGREVGGPKGVPQRARTLSKKPATP